MVAVGFPEIEEKSIDKIPSPHLRSIYYSCPQKTHRSQQHHPSLSEITHHSYPMQNNLKSALEEFDNAHTLRDFKFMPGFVSESSVDDFKQECAKLILAPDKTPLDPENY